MFCQNKFLILCCQEKLFIYNDIARKHGNVTVTDFRKYEKQLKVDINFLKISKQLGVYPKFLIFKVPNVSNKDAISIRKRLLPSAINKRNKELQDVSKELCQSKTIKCRLTLKRVRDMIRTLQSKPFYTNNFLLLTSKTLTDLKHLAPRTCFKNR